MNRNLQSDQCVFDEVNCRIKQLNEKAEYLTKIFNLETGLNCVVEPPHVYNRFALYNGFSDDHFRVFIGNNSPIMFEAKNSDPQKIAEISKMHKNKLESDFKK